MLEGSGTYVQQQLRGLRRGSVYELRLRMANRPGYGDDETVVIKLDNHEIGESNHPSDDFSEYGVAFTARSSNPVLRIENNTPNEEDCSVFIDEVTVTSVQLGASIPIANGGFDEETVPGDNGFSYMTAAHGAGSDGNVLVQSGNGPWGGIPSAAGANFVSLQGMGSYIEQGLEGLTVGSTYLVSFSFGDRPGFGE